MKKNEEYWLNLYKEGKIEIDFETGQVWSFLTGNKYLLGTRQRDKTKYLHSSAGEDRQHRNNILLHRLIWICANGDIPEKMEVNHINGIKSDNCLKNLEIVDKSGNALHSRRVLKNKGGSLEGEENGFSVLTKKEVLEIRNEYRKGIITLEFLATKHNVSKSTIENVIKRKTWRHI